MQLFLVHLDRADLRCVPVALPGNASRSWFGARPPPACEGTKNVRCAACSRYMNCRSVLPDTDDHRLRHGAVRYEETCPRISAPGICNLLQLICNVSSGPALHLAPARRDLALWNHQNRTASMSERCSWQLGVLILPFAVHLQYGGFTQAGSVLLSRPMSTRVGLVP